MKTVYYAHSMYLYNTKQEKRDIELLVVLGFKVLNPNSEPYISKYKEIMKSGIHNMEYWIKLARSCDCIAFRSCPDGSILSGVGVEINKNKNMPIFELPRMLNKRTLHNINDTREYLQEIGER